MLDFLRRRSTTAPAPHVAPANAAPLACFTLAEAFGNEAIYLNASAIAYVTPASKHAGIVDVTFSSGVTLRLQATVEQIAEAIIAAR